MARKSRKTSAIVDKTEMERVFRVGIYVRLSVEDIRKKISESLDTQKRLLQSYVEERPYFELVEIFEDTNKSGTNFERPGFNRLMEAVKSRKIDCIVVKDLSRFGRNYIEAGNYLEKIFPFLGIRFVSVNDSYDSADPSCQGDGLSVPLKNLINDIYARDISKKIRSSIATKRIRGEFSGGIVAYGYLRSETDDGKLVVDEETAPVVRSIFNWSSEGMGYLGVAQKLNEMGVPSPAKYHYERGLLKDKRYENAQYWYKSTVKRILTNPVYTGNMVQGRFRSGLFEGLGNIAVPEDQWVTVENTHEPIISLELFEKVQLMVTQKRETYINKLDKPNSETKKGNILKGIIFCGNCHRYMIRRRIDMAGGQSIYCYLCSTNQEIRKNACSPNRIDEAELLPVIFTAIRKQIDIAVNIDGIFETLAKKVDFKDVCQEIDDSIAETERKITKLTGLKSALYEDYAGKLLDEKEYLFSKDKYQEDVKALQQHLDELKKQRFSSSRTLSRENKWLKVMKSFKKERFLTEEMIAELIEKVEVYDRNSISIHFRYRDEFQSLCRFVEEQRQKAAAL